MARRRCSSAVGPSCAQSKPIGIKMKGFRPLPCPWHAIRGRHRCRDRRPLGLTVSRVVLSAHSEEVPAQVQGLRPHSRAAHGAGAARHS
jgi:hypothetical protein